MNGEFSSRGFTLLEIMMVVVILLTLAAVTLPKMIGTLGASRLKQAARDVTGVLRYARDYAVVTERSCEITFDPSRDVFQLTALASDQSRLDRKYVKETSDKVAEMMLSDAASGERQLPARVHFAVIYSDAPPTDKGDLPRIIYYPDGSATPGTIAIEDEKQHAISVEVFRTTGMARVAPGLPSVLPKAKKLYYGPGHHD